MRPLAIKKIEQKNNHAFSVTWSNGQVQDFFLADLQKNCPCANCTDEITGRRLVKEGAVKKDVRALFLRNVGRYALQIQFTSGCSAGIYSFDYLFSLNLSN